MTAKCANPSCNEPFHYFRTGKIYLIDAPTAKSALHERRPPEYFWLCGECTKYFVIRQWTVAGLLLRNRCHEEAEQKHLQIATKARLNVA